MRKPPRHTFIFRIDAGDGEPTRKLEARAVVRRPKAGVELILRADDVRRSMKLKGVGNTQTCSMAICGKRHGDLFEHAVEGYIDWQYSRAYVVSKVSRVTGLPIECYVYRHHDGIAQMNDTKDGQQKLLRMLELGGPRTIRLFPPPKRGQIVDGRPHGRRTGERSPRLGTGAKLRFAVAQLGGV